MSLVMSVVIGAGGVVPSVMVDQLAAANIGIIVRGRKRQKGENQELVRNEKELLSRPR